MPGSEGQRKVIRIFQSYGWNDASDIAQRLRASLHEAGYEVWLDREHLRADDKHFSLALEKAVTDSEVVVALLSPHSVRGAAGDERSSICYNELRLADELLRPIVPVRVRKFTGPPPFLIIKYRRVDWLDWDDPDAYRKGLREITQAIEQVLETGKLLDPDIAFQASSFAPQLRTALGSFSGRGWLFARLDAWLEGKAPCFLIEGVTGSGKTAIAAELVRRNAGGQILAYHFCTPVAQTLDPASFVRSVAGMLATSIDAYAEQLWNGKLAGWLTASDPDTMLRQGVLAPLQAVPMAGTFFIVVDALDEAVSGDGQVSLPQLLATALPEFPPWLKLLATTRPHQRIQRMFRGAEGCILGGDSAGQREDLDGFVQHRLAQEGLGQAVPPQDRAGAALRIEARAAGSFQYAGSVLDALEGREMTLAQLDQLPAKLEDFYFARAQRRFPNPPDYRLARIVLGVILAAREPLGLELLATLTGLDQDAELQPALDAVSCFAGPDAGRWRIAHKSIADWLLSEDAGPFRVDPQPGRARILAHCQGWATHHEAYALKHAIAHLLEAGDVAAALASVQGGLFAQRLTRLDEPRLDAEDSRGLTRALVAAHDQAGILALAQTTSVWQRDGVASALQSAPQEALPFVDQVVGALLALQP